MPSPIAASRTTWTTPVLVALATVYVVWGSTYFAIRVTLQSFTPLMQGGIRFLLAGLLLFGFLCLRGVALPTRRQWRDGAIVGVMLLTVGNGGVAIALQYVPSSLAAIFVGAGPLAAALWSGCFGIWPNRIQWLGIFVGFGGILMLSSGSQLAGSPIGIAALLASIVCWTGGSVLAQRVMKLAPGAMGFATEMLAGGVAMLALAFARGEAGQMAALGAPTPAALAALTYLVFAGSLAAFSAYMYLLTKVSPTIAISYAYVNPLIAVLLGVAFGGEVLTLRESMATAVIVGSVILLTRERRR